MMNPEIKQRWLKALRSGEYQQGHNFLKQDDKFCCLGVLCDVIKDDIDAHWDKKNRFVTKEDYNLYVLTPDVLKYCGLNESYSVMVNCKELNLTYLNDCIGYNFNQIAELIEEQL